jgi:hypothetical protein
MRIAFWLGRGQVDECFVSIPRRTLREKQQRSGPDDGHNRLHGEADERLES